MHFSASVLLSTLGCIHGQDMASTLVQQGSQISSVAATSNWLSEAALDIDKYSVIPPHFWTASRSRGNSDGWGTADGDTHITLKGHNGKYVGYASDGGVEGQVYSGNSPVSKFRVEILGKNKIALKGWNGKYMCCDNGTIKVNRDNLHSWEMFTVFTTSDKSSTDLPEGQDYVALKGVNGFLAVEPNGKVTCNRARAGPWERFSGWTAPISWTVKKIDFDLESGVKGGSKPQNLGRVVVNNLEGSIVRSMSKEISQEVAETSTFSNEAGVGLEVSTTFETGVPFVAKGEISASVSASYSHTWGTETTKTKKFTDTIHCVSPAYTTTVCEYVAAKANLNVPYKMTIAQGSYNEKIVEGTWEGVSVFEDHMIYEEIEKDEANVCAKWITPENTGSEEAQDSV